MSPRYGELDLAALDRWIMREPPDPVECDCPPCLGMCGGPCDRLDPPDFDGDRENARADHDAYLAVADPREDDHPLAGDDD